MFFSTESENRESESIYFHLDFMDHRFAEATNNLNIDCLRGENGSVLFHIPVGETGIELASLGGNIP